VWTRL